MEIINRKSKIPENVLEVLFNKYGNNCQTLIELSHNPSLTWNMIINNIHLNWDWDHLSKTVDWKYIKKYPHLKWNWDYISLNPNISWCIIEKYIDLPWNWNSIIYHPCVTFEIIMKYNKNQTYKKGYPQWNMSYISWNPNITWNHIQEHPEISWNYLMLSLNNNISIDCIFENMHLHWSWIDISRDPRLKWEHILKKQKSNKPWSDLEWCYISKHLNVTWEHIKSTVNFEYNNTTFGWNWEYITQNPNITFDIIKNNILYPWNYSKLLYNKNITFDTIKYNPEIDWEIDNLSLAINILNSKIDDIESNLNFIIEKNYDNYMWFHLSQVVSPDIIISRPELPWSYNGIARNKHLTLEHIDKLSSLKYDQLNWIHFSWNTFNYQKRFNEYLLWKSRDRAAKIIQRGCANWIDKPITADGKYGISIRIGMKALFNC